MRRELPRVVLLVTQAFIACVALLFHARVRPDLRALYTGITMPASASIALSTWWIPVTIGLGIAAGVVGLVARQRRVGLTWLGAGVAVSGLSFAAAAISAYAPLLR
jgi:hypothetical protein